MINLNLNMKTSNELIGWGTNYGQFITKKQQIDLPKRLGISNIKQVTSLNDHSSLAVIDSNDDLFVVGRSINKRIMKQIK